MGGFLSRSRCVYVCVCVNSVSGGDHVWVDRRSHLHRTHHGGRHDQQVGRGRTRQWWNVSFCFLFALSSCTVCSIVEVGASVLVKWVETLTWFRHKVGWCLKISMLMTTLADSLEMFVCMHAVSSTDWLACWLDHSTCTKHFKKVRKECFQEVIAKE